MTTIEELKVLKLDTDTVDDFLRWEEASRDTIDVKRCYIDLAGDLVTGFLLSQIIFWFLPSKGKSKLRIEREGKQWLAKGRADWWDECRISTKQFDRSIKILRDKGLVETRLWHFGRPSVPTLHIHLNLPALVEGVKSILLKGKNTFCLKGKIDLTEKVKCTDIENLIDNNIDIPHDSINHEVGDAHSLLDAQTDASRYLFLKMGRKRWQNLVQKEEFEKIEVEVGAARMVEAIDWALVTGISNIKSIITAAKNGKPPERQWRSRKKTRKDYLGSKYRHLIISDDEDKANTKVQRELKRKQQAEAYRRSQNVPDEPEELEVKSEVL